MARYPRPRYRSLVTADDNPSPSSSGDRSAGIESACRLLRAAYRASTPVFSPLPRLRHAIGAMTPPTPDDLASSGEAHAAQAIRGAVGHVGAGVPGGHGGTAR